MSHLRETGFPQAGKRCPAGGTGVSRKRDAPLRQGHEERTAVGRALLGGDRRPRLLAQGSDTAAVQTQEAGGLGTVGLMANGPVDGHNGKR